MAFVIPTIYKAIDQQSAVFVRMGRNMQNFAYKAETSMYRLEWQMRRVQTPVRGLINQLSRLGVVLSATALIGIVGGAISIFKDFEQSNANLAAVLDISIAQTAALAARAKELGATTAFTATQVSDLQTEYAKLGFSEREIQGATGATLSLAAATKTELAQAAVQVGSAIRSFNLDASEAARVSDVYAAAISKSALDMEKLDAAMSTVAPVAAKFGFSIEDTVALLAKLIDAGFDASTAATSVRNILLNLADSNGKLAKSLGKPVKDLPSLVAGLVKLDSKGLKLAKTLELTDKRSVAAFNTFLTGAKGIEQLSIELQNAEGAADEMAEKMLNTLGGSLTILQSSYEGFILSMEDGRGPYSDVLKDIVDVAAEMLTLASGSAKAAEELSKKEQRIRSLATTALGFVSVLLKLISVYVALRVIIWLTRGAMVAYNVVLGISMALQNKSALYLIGNTLAYKAYRVAMVTATAAKVVWSNVVKAATTAQLLWNAAMTNNPIGIIIVAVGALIGLIAAVITHWDSWGKTVSLFLGPLGAVINLIQSFRRNWDLIKKAFTEGGIIEGIKMIGKTILDSMLSPLQHLLELAAKLPGKMGDWASAGAEKLNNFRSKLGVNMDDESTDPASSKDPVSIAGIDSGGEGVTSPEVLNSKILQETITKQQQNVKIDIADKTGRASVESDNDLASVNVTPTNGLL